MTRRGWILLIAAALAAAAFAYQNRMERAALSIGPFHLYALPLAVLLLVSFLLGMGAMLLVSLPADRRTRELLRAHGLLDAGPVIAPPPGNRSPDRPESFGPRPADPSSVDSAPDSPPAQF